MDAVRQLKKVFNFPLRETESEALQLPQLLIEALVHLSDRFEGAPICLVSGYRCRDCNKFQKSSSRHITAEAADVVFLGIDNADLATYLLYLNESDERFRGRLGIGYYPNQEHVHIDVRAKPMYWVDKSPGGTPADYASNSMHPMDAFFRYYDARKAPARRGSGCPMLSEHESSEAEQPEQEAAPQYEVRWKNMLFTEPPSHGTPLMRRKFRGKKVNFAPVLQLDGVDQL